MSVEEERAELILKKAESHETTHIPERVQPHLSWSSLSQGNQMKISTKRSITSTIVMSVVMKHLITQIYPLMLMLSTTTL